MSAPESKTDWSYRGLCPHLHPHPHQSRRAACHKHRHPALASGTVAGSSSLTAGIQLMCMQYGCKLHSQCPQYTNTITFSLSTSLWRERKLSSGCLVREREVMESGWKPNVEISPNCPRCGSCNTKFCYYNNYSLTQPRYFCKSCRRYWTKGGSLRNVPVGGGCRKSRRCKSIRISGTGMKVGPTKDFGYNGNILGESASSSSSSMVADGSIDLARVYADFLNQESVPKTRFEMPKLPRDVDLSFHYASTNMNTNFNFQFPLEMDLISKGGEMYQETIEEFGSDRVVSNYGLPPLPGEEVVVAPEMEWPSSDMMVPNHYVHMSQLDRIESEDQHSKQFIGNKSSLFDMSSYETLFRP